MLASRGVITFDGGFCMLHIFVELARDCRGKRVELVAVKVLNWKGACHCLSGFCAMIVNLNLNLDKDLKRTVALFRTVINEQDCFGNALKNMAMVLNQLNRSDEAIQAIGSFRHLYLCVLVQRTGRADELLSMLHHQLKEIEEGRTTRFKQNKKNPKTPEQEKSMCVCKYKAAEIIIGERGLDASGPCTEPCALYGRGYNGGDSGDACTSASETSSSVQLYNRFRLHRFLEEQTGYQYFRPLLYQIQTKTLVDLYSSFFHSSLLTFGNPFPFVPIL
ncbi:hypothetical protein RJT34_14347 [Clitoria ternatea]|uniref:Uncharacterized protein n=1 Tax=Clitoria ternatea TaxID=43366 RepID=A0AAN9PL13_CLITE